MPCVVCDPELDPVGERLGSNHYAVRFGHHATKRVLLDGEEVKGCLEVVTGPGGWALREDVQPYSDQGIPACECGSQQPLRRWFEHSDGYSVESI